MKRLKREQEQIHIDTEGSWAISYGDMITLLLGFFILFFSLEPETKKRVEDLAVATYHDAING